MYPCPTILHEDQVAEDISKQQSLPIGVRSGLKKSDSSHLHPSGDRTQGQPETTNS